MPDPDRDREFIDRAIDLSERAVEHDQAPFGAVIVDASGEVIGEGYNTSRADQDPAAHGEVSAMRDAWRRTGTWQRDGSTCYTSTEPCLSCSFLLTQAGVGRIVFAARGTDVPGYKPLLGADATQVAAWIAEQPDWPPLEVTGDIERERARAVIARVWPS